MIMLVLPLSGLDYKIKQKQVYCGDSAKVYSGKKSFRQLPNMDFLPFSGAVLNRNYDEWFKAYLKFVDEKQSIAHKFKEIFLRPDFKTHINNSSVKFLDIGCGNGVLTEKFLTDFCNNFKTAKVELDAIDVNSNLLEEFNHRFVQLPENVKIFSDKKDFFNSDINKKYDFIIASHVLYYADNLSDSLIKIHNSLSDNGRALIVHHSGKDCILAKLRAKYNPLSSANLNQAENEISKKDLIAELLYNKNIKFDLYRQYFNLNFPEKIEHIDLKNLISFIIDKPYSEILRENKLTGIIKDISANMDSNRNLNLFNNIYVISKES